MLGDGELRQSTWGRTGGGAERPPGPAGSMSAKGEVRHEQSVRSRGVFGRDFLEPSLEGHFPSKGSPRRPWSGRGVCDFVLQPHTVSRGQYFERCSFFPVSIQRGGQS